MARHEVHERNDLIEGARVEKIELRPDELALSTLADIGHIDATLLHIANADSHSAEQWARIILEGASAEMRADLERAWQKIALRRHPIGAARTVQGWPIAHIELDYALLQVASDFGFEGQLLFRRDARGVLLATFIRFDEAAGRAVWDLALPAHLRFVRTLLEGAHARVTAERVDG
ncbi:hypothetical protein [Nocardia sp. NPDC057668]|uniref:hypothetical protein n=1 Tax=Nocardia sp. NPDC057668 TaxID=3346202 RepID=UPI00366E0675